MTIFSSKMKWYFSIGFFSSFFISKSKFLIEISILQRKSHLLKCIVLMKLKNFEKWRGSKSCKCRFLAPLLLCHFLSDINMMSIKRSHFSSKIDISRKKNFWNWKNWTTLDQKVPLHPAAKNGHFTKGFSQNL